MQLFITSLFALALIIGKDAEPKKLANTKWNGTINIPEEAPCTFSFKNDTLFAYVGGQLFETNTYEERGDTLFMKKITGNSPCGQEVGQYKYEVKDNVLTISTLKDDCEERRNCFKPEGYKKGLN
jgi:cell wall-associated protease